MSKNTFTALVQAWLSLAIGSVSGLVFAGFMALAYRPDNGYFGELHDTFYRHDLVNGSALILTSVAVTMFTTLRVVARLSK